MSPVLNKYSRYLDVHVEVVPHLVHDVGEGGAELLPVPLVIRDDVAVPVPQLPQLLVATCKSQARSSFLVFLSFTCAWLRCHNLGGLRNVESFIRVIFLQSSIGQI